MTTETETHSEAIHDELSEIGSFAEALRDMAVTLLRDHGRLDNEYEEDESSRVKELRNIAGAVSIALDALCHVSGTNGYITGPVEYSETTE